MTLDEAIAHCLEVAEQNDFEKRIYDDFNKSGYEEYRNNHCQCATDHRQLAEWLTELKQWRRVYGVCPSYEMCIPECREGYDAQIVEYKRLLKAAVEDFAKLDRENAWNKNCMMPEMDCADCPLSWDSVDDSVEPCHNWRYADEALALLGKDTNVPASKDGDTNVGHKSGGWISCKDRMPEVNEPVLFIFNTESGFKAVMYGWHETIKGLGSGWHQAGVGGARADEEVTYWQPLPEPPKE